MLLSMIELLPQVDTLYLDLGKAVAEISKIEKQIIRKTENIFG